MRIVALVPARSGSKSVADKNIADLGGHPLLGWTIRVALQCRLIERVVVSINSRKYADIAEYYGGEVPFLRPDEISADGSTDLEVMRHAVESLGLEPSDLIVHLRPTTPFRESDVVDNAIELFIAYLENDVTACRSVHPLAESARKYFELNPRGFLTPLMDPDFDQDLDVFNAPDRDAPQTFVPNGYVDVIRVSKIIRDDVMHGNRVIPFVTNRVIEVDSQEDLNDLRRVIIDFPSVIRKLFGEKNDWL